MNTTLGQTCWVISDKFIPNWKIRDVSAPLSSETMCVLNTSAQDASMEVVVYFDDRDPLGPFKVAVPARRLSKLNFNDFILPEPIPYDTCFAAVIQSDIPVVVQGGHFEVYDKESVRLEHMLLADQA